MIGSTSMPDILLTEEWSKSLLNSPTRKSKIKSVPSNSYQDTSDFISPEININNMQDSPDKSNNGTSCKEVVLESNQSQYHVLTKKVVKNQLAKILALFYTRNVTSKDSLPESALNKLSLTLTTKSNLSKSQRTRLSTCMIYLVSMVRTLNSLNPLNVLIRLTSTCLKNTELSYSKK